MNIYEKIAATQQELIVGKESWNEHAKFKYRSCEDIMKALKPLMSKLQYMILPSSLIEEIAGRVFVTAKVRLINLEDQSDIYEHCYSAQLPDHKANMDAAQVVGSTTSYARKYALAELFLIDNTRDSYTDGDNDSNVIYEQGRTQAELQQIHQDAQASKVTNTPQQMSQVPAASIATPVQQLTKDQLIAGMKACKTQQELTNLYISQVALHNDADVNAIGSKLFNTLKQ